MRVDLLGVVEDGSHRLDSIPLNTGKSLRLVRGQTTKVFLRVVNPDGSPYSADGAVFTIKKNSYQMSLSAGQSLQIDGVSSGNEAVFSITSAQMDTLPTGRYVYDVWLVSGVNRQRIVSTSELFVEPSVR